VNTVECILSTILSLYDKLVNISEFDRHVACYYLPWDLDTNTQEQTTQLFVQMICDQYNLEC